MALLSRKPHISTDPKAIEELLTRGVEDTFVLESLKAKLQSGKQLRVKLGFDPTSPYIHIGRAIILRKLRDFQKLGHKAVFIVGDFTARVGDPSDKLEKRPMLTKAAIEKNIKTYKAQVGKIIDLKNAEFHYNSTWLKKLGFEEIAELAESFTVQQMTTRRNFADRIEKGDPISVREFLYPLMQGYDSVAVEADVELGGFDQLFNVKAGRVIQKHYGKPEQDVLTVQMLEGTDGRKMSSSWGNIVAIVDEPSDMYGKIMALRDELIPKYFMLCTDLTRDEVKEIETKLASGTNPKELKMKLAREIVRMYNGDKAAEKAEANFVETFSKGGRPDTFEELTVPSSTLVADVLVEKGIVASKTEFTRLVKEGAISHLDSGEKITDPKAVVTNSELKIGKRRFVKITVK